MPGDSIVPNRAKEISSLMDQGSGIAASDALRADLQRMSPPEFNNLLNTIAKTEKDNVGFDLLIKARGSDEKPGGPNRYELFINFDNSIFPKVENVQPKPVSAQQLRSEMNAHQDLPY
jgi:hypothetical protein